MTSINTWGYEPVRFKVSMKGMPLSVWSMTFVRRSTYAETWKSVNYTNVTPCTPWTPIRKRDQPLYNNRCASPCDRMCESAQAECE